MGPLHIRETHVLHGTDARKAFRRGIQLPLVVGELLQRADFATRANDRNQVVGLDFFVHKLAQMFPDRAHALHRNAEIVDDQCDGSMAFVRAHGRRRRSGLFFVV